MIESPPGGRSRRAGLRVRKHLGTLIMILAFALLLVQETAVEGNLKNAQRFKRPNCVTYRLSLRIG